MCFTCDRVAPSHTHTTRGTPAMLQSHVHVFLTKPTTCNNDDDNGAGEPWTRIQSCSVTDYYVPRIQSCWLPHMHQRDTLAPQAMSGDGGGRPPVAYHIHAPTTANKNTNTIATNTLRPKYYRACAGQQRKSTIDNTDNTRNLFRSPFLSLGLCLATSAQSPTGQSA